MQDIINRLRAKKDDEGFTLIELLVVVVIIGVLVAIAVPVYLNYREGAADKSAQSDVRGAISAIEQFYTENGNKYPAQKSQKNISAATATMDITVTGATKPGKITLSDNTELSFVPPATGSGYKICAHNSGGSPGADGWYLYDSSTGGSVKKAGKELTLTTCA
ncbi:prepilin-type N-terminal cleavage/methylation domain-containing protein [Actinoplanes sp. NPDC051859]|uniref:prepilin-type N-terminal cleavage/methylation domain-containing protein n=1 Tax=Actinoplanes sp. NPDC051859 TaxID=3363909 RepID=UPI0037A4C816